ncbi:MAG: glycerol-3-phosphate acyltransferase [Methanomassiliicoccales archaeon]
MIFVLLILLWCMPSYGAGAAVLLFYLYGALPFPLIILYMRGQGDIFTQGSSNIGVANAFRSGGMLTGSLVVLSEVSKVALPLLVSYLLFDGQLTVTVGLLAAVLLATNYSMYIGFRGGVGVTIAIYSLLVLAPLVLALVAATYLVLKVTVKDSYWCLLLAYATAPLYLFLLSYDMRLVLFALLAVMLMILKYDRRIDDVRLLEKELARGAA